MKAMGATPDIEDLKELDRVMSLIAPFKASPVFQDLKARYGSLAQKYNVSDKELFDLAETNQIPHEDAVVVLDLAFDIRRHKSE